MTQLETLSTLRPANGRNLDYWNDGATPKLSPLVSDPRSVADFIGHLARTTNGTARIAEIYSDPQIVRHGCSQVSRNRTQVHFLHLQLEGESVNRQDQREARLKPRDMTICDNSRPYEIVFEKPSRMLVFAFADELLQKNGGINRPAPPTARVGKVGDHAVEIRNVVVVER